MFHTAEADYTHSTDVAYIRTSSATHNYIYGKNFPSVRSTAES